MHCRSRRKVDKERLEALFEWEETAATSTASSVGRARLMKKIGVC
jgi:hypothetical protein